MHTARTEAVDQPAGTDDPSLVVVKHEPFNAEAPIDAMAAAVTPTESFFVRSNFALPAVDAGAHRIAVEGAVRQPYALSIDELRALPMRTVLTTMECAGNDRLTMPPLVSGELWQGGAVSTGTWTGVSLADVLERAGVESDAVEILLEGADRGPQKGAVKPFARSLPLDKALHRDTLLALEMNGEPLPARHGAPVRLVVPGWYGVASVKWVARVVALREPFVGYFQTDRYVYVFPDGRPVTPVRALRVKSMIASPAQGAAVPLGTVRVRGWAWSGEAPVARVEVAVDGGDGWKPARLLPETSQYAWRGWEFEWAVEAAGRHVLRSRATDASGNVQPAVAEWNALGYGNNAVQPVVVTAG